MRSMLKLQIKHAALIAAVLLMGCSASAESLVEQSINGPLRIRQLPGTQELLKAYHGNAFKSDTVYSLIIPLGNCPRCEIVLPTAIQFLKKYEAGKDIQVIALYPDSVVAESYLKRYNLVADFVKFDTNDGYKKIYNCNSGTISVPYLLKIVPRTGELIVGMKPQFIRGKFFRELRDYNTPIGAYEFSLGSKFEGFYKPSAVQLKQRCEMRVSVPDSVNLSEVDNRPDFCGNFLFFTDKLNEAVLGFTYTDGDSLPLKMCAFIQPDSAQKRTFADVDDDVYNEQIEDKALRFIPLSPKIIGNSLYASYSLPKLWITDSTNLNYMNQACAIKFDLDSVRSGSHGHVIPFGFELEHFFDMHFMLYDYDGNVALDCEKKTWPMGYDKEEYAGQPRRDPFMKEFYQYDNPTVAVFDHDSLRLLGRYEQLPELAEQTLTGYYFASAVVDSYAGARVYSDGFSGAVRYYGKDGVMRQYQAFSIDPSLLPSPDSTKFYSYDCVEPYRAFFNRKIIELRVTPSHIYCLMRYRKNSWDLADVAYSVVAIDLKTGKTQESRFPAEATGCSLACGLRRNADVVEPYEIIRAAQGVWKLKLFSAE